MADDQGYGLWLLAVLNAAIFILFAFSFTKPKTKRDWRGFGAFSAFIIALFTEMYGFPLTRLLSSWLGNQYPGLDLYTHNAGHLWETLLGWKGDPHLNPLHLLSYALIAWGFITLSSAWPVLRAAQRDRKLATTGPYAKRRHPQYFGFIVTMVGFLMQCPTILTFLMFPILVVMYVGPARREEREAEREFGDAYRNWAAVTPGVLAWRRGATIRKAGNSRPQDRRA